MASLVIRVPLRVSFCGGGTDLKEFYLDHEGAVLFTNIAKYVYIVLSERIDNQIVLRDLDFGVETEFHYNEAPQDKGIFDIAKATIHFLKIQKGVTVAIKSDVAPGSGLGTSSAIGVGLLKGLIEFFRLDIPNHPTNLAEMAYTVERDILNFPGGVQDQYAAAYKGINLLQLNKNGKTIHAVNARESFLEDLQMNLMLCYSGQTHVSSDITEDMLHQPQLKKQLQKIYGLTQAFVRAFEEENMGMIAQLMHASHEEKTLLSAKVETPNIKLLYAAAKQDGALGGKILGAGGGGYLLLVVPFDKQQEVKKSLRALGGQPEPFVFDMQGIKIWRGRL